MFIFQRGTENLTINSHGKDSRKPISRFPAAQEKDQFPNCPFPIFMASTLSPQLSSSMQTGQGWGRQKKLGMFSKPTVPAMFISVSAHWHLNSLLATPINAIRVTEKDKLMKIKLYLSPLLDSRFIHEKSIYFTSWVISNILLNQDLQSAAELSPLLPPKNVCCCFCYCSNLISLSNPEANYLAL